MNKLNEFPNSRNNELKISVWDYNNLQADQLIGTTVIDLEDRLRSKYGAMCGLPLEYSSSGYNKWRNSLLPSEMLSNLCSEFQMEAVYGMSSVTIAGMRFYDSTKIAKSEDLKERLALTALNNFNKIEGIGYKLIPEHVETRSLFREDRPGIEQGKLQLFIEIFDTRRYIPSPVDIWPLPGCLYVLRVVVWNTMDIILDDINIFGKPMSDIYVKW